MEPITKATPALKTWNPNRTTRKDLQNSGHLKSLHADQSLLNYAHQVMVKAFKKMVCQLRSCFCAVYLYGASASLRNPSCRLSSNLQHHSKPVFARRFVTKCKSHNCGFGACVVPVLTCTVLDQIQLQLYTLVLPDGVCLGFQLLETHSAER